MGCDIHVHVEVRVDDEWLHYSNPIVDRDYELFAYMGGARSDGFGFTPISDGRPLPADMSAVTAACYAHEKSDAHTEGFLCGKEIADVEKWCWERRDGKYTRRHFAPFGYICGNGVGMTGDRGSSYPSEFDDVRLIFWFDN